MKKKKISFLFFSLVVPPVAAMYIPFYIPVDFFVLRRNILLVCFLVRKEV